MLDTYTSLGTTDYIVGNGVEEYRDLDGQFIVLGGRSGVGKGHIAKVLRDLNLRAGFGETLTVTSGTFFRVISYHFQNIREDFVNFTDEEKITLVNEFILGGSWKVENNQVSYQGGSGYVISEKNDLNHANVAGLIPHFSGIMDIRNTLFDSRGPIIEVIVNTLRAGTNVVYDTRFNPSEIPLALLESLASKRLLNIFEIVPLNREAMLQLAGYRFCAQLGLPSSFVSLGLLSEHRAQRTLELLAERDRMDAEKGLAFPWDYVREHPLLNFSTRRIFNDPRRGKEFLKDQIKPVYKR